MTIRIAPAPVRKSIVVKATPERAFSVFASGMGAGGGPSIISAHRRSRTWCLSRGPAAAGSRWARMARSATGERCSPGILRHGCSSHGSSTANGNTIRTSSRARDPLHRRGRRDARRPRAQQSRPLRRQGRSGADQPQFEAGMGRRTGRIWPRGWRSGLNRRRVQEVLADRREQTARGVLCAGRTRMRLV